MTEKKSSKRRRKKATDEELHEKVRKTVGRGLEAFFETEASAETATSGEETAADLAAMLEAEAEAAGDVREELKEAGGEASPASEAAATTTSAPPDEEMDLETIIKSLPKEPETPTTARTDGATTATTVTEQPAEAQPLPTRTTARPSPPTTAEAATEARAPTEEEAAPAADVTPPRLRPAGILMEQPMRVTAEAPGPETAAEPTIPEARPVTPTLTREEILQRLSDERLQALSETIDRLYDELTRTLAHKEEVADRAFQALQQARGILWTRPEDVVQAEYLVNQVRAIVNRYRLSEEWGRTYGFRLLVYETVFLLLFLGGFLAIQLGQTAIVAWITARLGPAADTTFTAVTVPFLTTLMWGGIGGVVGALYSLWWHVAQVQDFDRRYIMWYLVQPIMGFVLGGIVFLIISTGFLALQGTLPSPEAARGIQMFPALVAALGGFRQKFVYELLERIIRVLTPTPESRQPTT